MTLWLNHTIDERIAMLQRAEEKFRINQVAAQEKYSTLNFTQLFHFLNLLRYY